MDKRPDPAENVKRDVIQWYRDVLCFPTWDELLEVEYVRRCGGINMFTDDVVGRCKELGLQHAVDWYRRLSQAGVLPSTVFGLAVNHYSQEHGPADTWLTEDIINEFRHRSTVNVDCHL